MKRGCVVAGIGMNRAERCFARMLVPGAGSLAVPTSSGPFPISSSGGDGGVVAVVDDDEAFRESLGALLDVTARRLRLRLCPTAEPFLQLLAVERFACVNLDVHLPGLSEASAVSALRQAAPDLAFRRRAEGRSPGTASACLQPACRPSWRSPWNPRISSG